jgi:hypothetical protein
MRFHAELNALFMQAGLPGDPPEGNKTQKCLSWLRRANSECADPLSLFGTLIAEVMDAEPTAWRLEQYTKVIVDANETPHNAPEAADIRENCRLALFPTRDLVLKLR